MKEPVRGLLMEIGFSGLEADVYLALRAEPEATGYRVSRLIGKPVPNTYKALDSLRARGAIVADESTRGRTYVAIAIPEYLDGVKRSLDATRDRIEAELKEQSTVRVEEGIYRLTTVAQVYERVRAMLAGARTVALVDAFPEPLRLLHRDLEAAARRGVKIFVKAYAPVHLAGCEVLAPKREAPHLKVWDGDWLNVAVDASEFVESLLKKAGAGIHEAVWSRNRYLALLTYNGMMQELSLTMVYFMLHNQQSAQEIRLELQRVDRRYLGEMPLRPAIERWGTKAWRDELARVERRRRVRIGARPVPEESPSAAKRGKARP